MEKFDVFLSFREIDTGRSFVSHLYHSLVDKQIRTFKNGEDHRSGDREIVREIEEAKIAIAVISKNYISSTSCLNELEMMIECKEKGSLVIVPVFYEVDPCAFAKEAHNLASKLRLKHYWKILEESTRLRKDMLVSSNKLSKRKESEVNKWRDALVDLTLLYEAYANGVEDDAEMINKVMDCIAYHLRATSSRQMGRSMDHATVRLPPSWSDLSIGKLITMAIKGQEQGSVSKRDMDQEKEESSSVNTRLMERSVPCSRINNLVGMDRKMKEVDTLLKLNSKDGVAEIGIWGVGGVGKTTLARCIYEQISSQFQDYYYYTNNKNSSSLKSQFLVSLLEEIIRAALEKPISQSNENRNCDVAKAKLGHRKVLLVVDGVNCIDQLKRIISVACLFGPGSRLILVTRDKNLLVECDLKLLYEVESLRYDEALQLFTQFSFEQKSIPRGFHQLSLRAVLIAGRLPLALRVLGSFLCGRNIKEWEFEILKLEQSRNKHREEDAKDSSEKDREGSKFKPNMHSYFSPTFDVFLSFHGTDTRHTILSYLYNALVKKGIVTFKDTDSSNEMGGTMVDTPTRALENSKVAVVVISENYATSRWCLNELQLIMNLEEKKRIEVIPIFYGLDPSDVKHHRRNFDLNMHQKSEVAEVILKWREVLARIANIEGVVCTDGEDQAVVRVIVELIWSNLLSISSIGHPGRRDIARFEK